MNMIGSTALISAALAAIVGCYTVSLHAANERAAIVASRERLARDTADIRLLRAELRTRSRLPELQRWNEQVLALAAPHAEQLMASPLLLAAYARPGGKAPAPAPVVAVVRDAPTPEPLLRRASFSPRIVHDLGTDATVAAATLPPGFTRVALR